jgi:hypothetical protein
VHEFVHDHVCFYVYVYSAIRNNDNMEFEGKWMQLEDIMLSEANQAQKDKGHMFLSYVEDRSKR